MDKVDLAKRDNWVFACKIFALGQAIGIPLAVLYMIYSPSMDRPFHSFVMWAGAGITFPLFSISIRIMLKMYYKAVAQEEKFVEVADQVKEVAKTVHQEKQTVDPIITQVKTTVDRVVPTIEKAAQAVDRVAENGQLEEALLAIREIPGKLDRIKPPPAAEDVNVPRLP